jgi:hypothetical protein
MLGSFRRLLFDPPNFWRINLAVWTAYGGVSFLIRLFLERDIALALAVTACSELLGFLASGVLRVFYRSAPAQETERPAFFVRIVLGSILAATVHAFLVQGFLDVLGQMHPAGRPAWAELWENLFLFSIHMGTVYLVWSLGYLWLKSELRIREDRLRQLQIQSNLQQMKLQLIRFQLDPHFLFNTLNGIAAEIPVHPRLASGMVDELAGYLKYSLEHRRELITPLGVEIDATAAYLRIQKIRFGRQLQIRIAASPATRKINVPAFLLQPLVENAFQHGRNQDNRALRISVQARRTRGGLSLEVHNTGELSAESSPEGLGLESVRKRLAISYPGRHQFTLRQKGPDVVAALTLEGEPCSA